MDQTVELTNADLIDSWYRAALAAVEPEAAVRRHLARDGRSLNIDAHVAELAGRLLVVAVGKAAVGMARGTEAVCGDLIAAGIAITKDGHAAPPLPRRIAVREAAHPIPDERGVLATREALELLSTANDRDLVLALLSGGGSALLEAPRPPLTLADLAATTDLLLKAGASIGDLNAVRVPLSLVKGGGLRAAARDARFATLILSDVLGNDPRVIASGPTVATDFTPASALAILDRYGVTDRVPAAVRDLLQHLMVDHASGKESSRAIPVDSHDLGEGGRTPPSPRRNGGTTEGKGGLAGGLGGRDILAIIADNHAAVAAAADAARATGRTCKIIWTERQGEASLLGREWVDRCAESPPDVDVLLGGGEATVTVRGDGIGGRNTEFALAAALALAERGLTDWTIASLATDGQDALTGVAGAVADARTVARAAAAGVDAATALRSNDSLAVFRAAGGIVAPGPTGTNVNDLYFAVRGRS